jgi:uncharacterized protein (UPF0332 family)
VSPDNRAANVAEEVAHAREAMQAAAALVDLGLARDAMNRIYYAVFHATLAVLLTEELEPTTHRGVLSLLGLHFVKTGRLPADMVATFKRLQGYREACDYTRGFVIPDELARSELEAARAYLEIALRYLDQAGRDAPPAT